MPAKITIFPYTCARCLRASQIENARTLGRQVSRPFTYQSPLRSSQHDRTVTEQKVEASIEAQTKESTTHHVSKSQPASSEMERGAMFKRLAEATEDALLEGGRAGRKAVEEAGFSEDLKQRLLERVESHKFKSENAPALAEAGLTSKAGRGSRDIAAAQAWTGEENPEDTMLRMLDDARKPLAPCLRGPAKIPRPVIDLRLKREPKQAPGERLANARDKSSIYAISKDTQMSDEERGKLRQELKERFAPGARAMPNSIRGLAALANERIEDAIARGQFKVSTLAEAV
jgi:hypothetical protein